MPQAEQRTSDRLARPVSGTRTSEVALDSNPFTRGGDADALRARDAERKREYAEDLKQQIAAKQKPPRSGKASREKAAEALSTADSRPSYGGMQSESGVRSAQKEPIAQLNPYEAAYNANLYQPVPLP
jgi:hypothetical protein